MLNVLRGWIHRYFSDEEAVVLAVLLVTAFAVVLTLGDMLAPVLAGLVLAFLMQGLVGALERVRIPHLVAVWLVFLMFVGALSVCILFLVPLLWQQVLRGIDFMRGEVGRYGQLVLTSSLSSLPLLLSLMIYLILVPILVFFFLKDRQQISDWLSGYLPRERALITQVSQEMNVQIANYIRGKAIEILICGVVSYAVFAALELNYAALLALLVGVSVVVPYIGATVVTIPIALIGLFQWGLGDQFIYLMVAYAIVQALDGNVLVPLLFSEAVNLHPVAIICSVLLFGGLWGFWGVFFAIPLATLFKAVLYAWPRRAPTVPVVEHV